MAFSVVPPPPEPTGAGFKDWLFRLWKRNETGVYTPTLTSVTNVSATTTNPFVYLRVGDMVTCAGLVAVDPTAGSSATTVRISLPISSNFTAATDGAGVAACSTVFGMSGAINSSSGNNAVGMNFVSDSGAANQTWAVHFTYRVK